MVRTRSLAPVADGPVVRSARRRLRLPVACILLGSPAIGIEAIARPVEGRRAASAQDESGRRPSRAARIRRAAAPSPEPNTAGGAAPAQDGQPLPRQYQVGEYGARPPQSAAQTGFSINERGVNLVSEDRTVKFRSGGRLHIDFNGVDPRRLPDSVGERVLIRRGRTDNYLNVRDQWLAAFQYDTANFVEPVFDAAVSYKGTSPFIVTVGQIREPFSLQQMSSLNEEIFIERAPVDALTPAWRFGGSVGAEVERWTGVAGVFGGSVNRGVERDGIAVTARTTYAPFLAGTDVLHLGAAGSYRAFDRNDRATVFDSAAVNDAFGAAFITSRAVRGASSLTRLGAEAVLQLGPFRAQGEYIVNEVERDLLPAAAPDRRPLRFDGAYVILSVPLNGPQRQYRLAPSYGTHFGIFGDMELPDEKRISRGGIGVFELAGRLAYLDLTEARDGGGFERSWTAELAWRPEPNVKVKLDYSRFDVRRTLANGGDLAVDVAEMRLQYYW